MKYRDCTIAYNEHGPIIVGASPDTTHWSDRFNYVIDGKDARAMTRMQQTIQMLCEFVNCIVRDEVPVDDAHLAYCAIDEYRTLMTERARVDEMEKRNAGEANTTARQ